MIIQPKHIIKVEKNKNIVDKTVIILIILIVQ